MKIDSYLVTSIAGGTNLVTTTPSGTVYKYARAIILRNVSGTVTLGSKERGTRPLPVSTDLSLLEVNRAGQSGKYTLEEVVLRGIGTTEIVLIDPSEA
jgi:hypothetical protein